MAKKNKPKRFYDYSLLFCVIFLTAFGLVMIYSASSYTAQLKYHNAAYFMTRQLLIASAGLVVALVISRLGGYDPEEESWQGGGLATY